ncbi:hypothetical protein GCM10010307_81550 [Streptomyces vastus]|uniref:Uncharacterized protein n=1 Tax=Streptomyces vastus TaxID=285451 RepID=A0ABP6EDU3_9ACTN
MRLDMGEPPEFVGELDTRESVEEPLVEAVADRVLDVIEPMAAGMAPSSRCGTIGASNRR